ncbi:hypothetical protein K7X08_024221 [Anisodus acutangulus]|uniref:Uncharacterized protein n=1 Tax=Anisodus acutangulus TaxID=402998 RepID=A0A9Q1M7D6_9SOLA|nr:hypothetical protein K7X08_024221 [Anisodus acutangulus]
MEEEAIRVSMNNNSVWDIFELEVASLKVYFSGKGWYSFVCLRLGILEGELVENYGSLVVVLTPSIVILLQVGVLDMGFDSALPELLLEEYNLVSTMGFWNWGKP